MGPRPTAAGAATGTAQVRGVPQYKYAPGVRNPQQHMPTQPQVPMQQVIVLLLWYLVFTPQNSFWLEFKINLRTYALFCAIL